MLSQRIHVSGVVQGVGFRPFVYNLAQRHALRGEVRNTSAGVDIAVEAIGKEVTLGHAFGTARIGGAITSLGVYGLDLQNLSIPVQARSKVPFTFYHRRFVTTLCPSGRNRLQRLMNLMQYGNLDLAPLWTHTLPLKNILEGYEMALDPKSKSIKVGVRVSG